MVKEQVIGLPKKGAEMVADLYVATKCSVCRHESTRLKNDITKVRYRAYKFAFIDGYLDLYIYQRDGIELFREDIHHILWNGRLIYFLKLIKDEKTICKWTDDEIDEIMRNSSKLT